MALISRAAPVPESTRRDDSILRTTGLFGMLSSAGLVLFLVVSSRLGPDPLGASHATLERSLADRTGSGIAGVVLIVSALTYPPLIVFFSGLRCHVDRLAGPLLASVVTIGSVMFLAGALAGDGFSLALPIAEHSVPTLHPSAETAQLLAAGWRICLTEAQVALAVVCAAGGAAVLRTSRSDGTICLPRWVGVWGWVGAVAVLPLLVAPGVQPIFVVSNLLRLTWIAVVGVVALRRSRWGVTV